MVSAAGHFYGCRQEGKARNSMLIWGDLQHTVFAEKTPTCRLWHFQPKKWEKFSMCTRTHMHIYTYLLRLRRKTAKRQRRAVKTVTGRGARLE